MRLYTQACGCSFPINEEELVKRGKDLDYYLKNNLCPPITLDINNVNQNCPEVWKMVSRGLTKGVFQLESSLGKQWTKKLIPTFIEHLCALGALLRPGCLRSVDKKYDCSLTELYCKRKNGELSVEYIHECLRPILENTYGVLTYQEQAMEIARVVAGFNLQEADMLRKAIGKKLPEEMKKVEDMFYNGAAKTALLTEEQYKEVFGWIKESQRYSFNKSHSFSYGVNGYWSAYCKAHFPLQFFTSYLRFAKDKQDPLEEIQELVNEAKVMDVDVLTPDLRDMKNHFYTNGKVIKFGLADVKGVGEIQIEKLKRAASTAEAVAGKKLASFNWFEFLVLVTPNTTSTVVERLIQVGAMSYMDKSMSRTRMLSEYKYWSSMTEREQNWIFDNIKNFKSFAEAVEAGAKPKKEGGACANVKRVEVLKDMVKLIKNPTNNMDDNPNEIVYNEEHYLGIPISCSKVDSCDTSRVNCSCKEFMSGRKGFLILGVVIDSIREVKIKRGKSSGKNMAFLTISDSSCALSDVCVFPEAYDKYSDLLTEGNTVLIQGERDSKKDSLVVKHIWQF